MCICVLFLDTPRSTFAASPSSAHKSWSIHTHTTPLTHGHLYHSDSYYGSEEGSTGGAKGESVSVSAKVGEGSESESGGETASSGSTESGGGEGANLVGGGGSEYTYSES